MVGARVQDRQQQIQEIAGVAMHGSCAEASVRYLGTWTQGRRVRLPWLFQGPGVMLYEKSQFC